MDCGQTESCLNNTIPEIPISVDDWEILIRQNGDWQDLYRSMKNSQLRKAFLLHPWRVGQKRYIRALEKYLDRYADRVITPKRYLDGEEGIVLTGDIGEFSLFELFRRTISK